MKSIALIPALLCRAFKLGQLYPAGVRSAKIMLLLWGAAAVLNMTAIAGSLISSTEKSGWWWLATTGSLAFDIVCFRWAAHGYVYARFRDDHRKRAEAERAEFDRIVATLK